MTSIFAVVHDAGDPTQAAGQKAEDGSPYVGSFSDFFGGSCCYRGFADRAIDYGRVAREGAEWDDALARCVGVVGELSFGLVEWWWCYCWYGHCGKMEVIFGVMEGESIRQSSVEIAIASGRQSCSLYNLLVSRKGQSRWKWLRRGYV